MICPVNRFFGNAQKGSKQAPIPVGETTPKTNLVLKDIPYSDIVFSLDFFFIWFALYYFFCIFCSVKAMSHH